MDFEQVLAMVDNAIKPVYLNKVQELVLRQTLEGKTYSEIATTYSYDGEYIKSVGCELWQLLSKSFGEPVSKSNFQQFIRRYVASTVQDEAEMAISDSDRRELGEKPQLQQYQDWGTAPDVSSLRGRAEELNQLIQWVNNGRCRLVIVFGLIGCGKTALVTKFAKQVQQQFDYVIWRSLRNAPPIEETLDTLIRFFSNEQVEPLPRTQNEKILQLLDYLRRSRCLIILDDLQSVLDSGDSTGHYRLGCEEYGQLLRFMVSTPHQSTIVVTSWDKPKGLTLYEKDPVRFLVLRGLQPSALQEIFGDRIHAEAQEEWQTLSERYTYNPQFLKIAASTIQEIFNGNISQFLRQKTIILDEIRTLLDWQFNRLPTLEKKIAYWLVIKRLPITVELFTADAIQPASKAKLLEAIVSLEQRSLLQKDEDAYILHPLVLEYLSCRLFEKIWEDNFTDKSRGKGHLTVVRRSKHHSG